MELHVEDPLKIVVDVLTQSESKKEQQDSDSIKEVVEEIEQSQSLAAGKAK